MNAPGKLALRLGLRPDKCKPGHPERPHRSIAARFLLRLAAGIELDFSDEALGFDTSLAVGPGGSFIGEEHTARYFRSEIWRPTVLDRQYYQAWLEEGVVRMG